MNIPPKYEDLVAQLETVRAREAGYLEVIAQQADTIANQCRSESLIQQRLTDAEKRVGDLKSMLREGLEEPKEGDDYIGRVIEALKE